MSLIIVPESQHWIVHPVISNANSLSKVAKTPASWLSASGISWFCHLCDGFISCPCTKLALFGLSALGFKAEVNAFKLYWTLSAHGALSFGGEVKIRKFLACKLEKLIGSGVDQVIQQKFPNLEKGLSGVQYTKNKRVGTPEWNKNDSFRSYDWEEFHSHSYYRKKI